MIEARTHVPSCSEDAVSSTPDCPTADTTAACESRDQPYVRETAALMRLLGDPTRIRLLSLLQDGERHVTNLCSHLDIAQPTVSHHLGLLRGAGLLRSRRNGKQIHYSLNPEIVSSGPDGMKLACGSIEVRLGDLATPGTPEVATSIARAAAG